MIDRRQLAQIRSAYRLLFGEPQTDAGLRVLADLRAFCHADRTTIKISPVSKTVDPLASAHAEGRREVWLRIQQWTHLDDATLNQLSEVSDE